jgi:Xaa-Pro aminopeptidase
MHCRVRSYRQLLISSLLLVFAAPIAAGQARPDSFPSLREQAVLQREWVRTRLETILPGLMRENGVKMWILSMREYNEDPVFSSIVSPTTLYARRRTIFVFNDLGPSRGVERLALGGSSQNGLYTVVRDTSRTAGELREELQWRLLRTIVETRDPSTIAVDISPTHAFADGLSASEWEQIQTALGPLYTSRVVRAERLAVEMISVRLPGMIPWHRRMMEYAHAIIAEAFSNRVITPGTTTAEDVVWWMRQKSADLGFGTWFHPSVDIQRRRNRGDADEDTARVIQRGDILHCDFGLTAMRLNTDTQHMGYVLREGETDVPAGLKELLRKSNRLQDILLANMSVGLTGNQILEQTLKQMKDEGIDGSVYSHPIGEHGHGAGPLIGLWDRQESISGRGDLLLRANTWFSIELQAAASLPEWDNQRVSSAQEEDAYVDEAGKVHWVLGRQEHFHIVR